MRVRIVCLLAIAGLLAAQEDPQVLLKKAGAALDAGRFAEAITASRKAALLFQKSGDAANRARALTHAGLAEMYSGDYGPAIQDFSEALQIARDTHEFGSEIARLNDLGNAYYFQGRYMDALEQYQEAQRRVEAVPHDRWTAWGRQLTTANIAILYQTLNQNDRALELYTALLHSPESLAPQEQAQMLSNVGVLRRRLGDPWKALDTYRAVQSLYRKEAHRDGEIAVLNNIGIVQAMDLRDFTAAATTFSTALSLAEQSGDRPLAVHARLYRGETRYRAGYLKQSAEDFRSAAGQAQALGEKEEQWKALFGLARIADRGGDARGARQLLERAVKLIESLRAGAGGPSMRSSFLADKREAYDLLIANATNVDDSFHWMEQSRARSLRDRTSAPIQTSSDVAHKLPADTAVLEYWLGNDSGAVLWITAAQTGMRRWRMTPEDRSAISRLPSLLIDPSNRKWIEGARPVAAQLLSGIPVLTDRKIHYLRIVPDGVLARIPFEALPFGDSGLLIERFAVSYSPSASMVPIRSERRGVTWPWQLTFEAFADPRPGAGGGGIEIVAARNWQRLPEANREVAGIERTLGGKAALHIGADARGNWLNATAPGPVLHFATHAFADPQSPDLSYILLAPARPSQRFDYLFLKEIYGLKLGRVQLVTLSACETDVGRFVPGEGTESLTQAFLAAGARSVVASLWAVGDHSTAELMLRFYSRLSAGESKADALRDAKLDFLASPAAAHPAYWAAFILTGDSSSRLPIVVGWSWLAAAAAPAMVLTMLRMRAKKVLWFRRSRPR